MLSNADPETFKAVTRGRVVGISGRGNILSGYQVIPIVADEERD
jgi:hypothetical protein